MDPERAGQGLPVNVKSLSVSVHTGQGGDCKGGWLGGGMGDDIFDMAVLHDTQR